MADESRPLRVVIDTNIVVRGILSSSGASAALLDAVWRGECALILSREALNEIHRVLSRPRFVDRYGVSRRQRQRLVTRLYGLAFLVQTEGRLALCRDPRDDYLIEMALLGQATHLVSEDEDLHGDPDLVEFLRRSGVQVARAGALVRALSATK